jgi:hypothetical protein
MQIRKYALLAKGGTFGMTTATWAMDAARQLWDVVHDHKWFDSQSNYVLHPSMGWRCNASSVGVNIKAMLS